MLENVTLGDSWETGASGKMGKLHGAFLQGQVGVASPHSFLVDVGSGKKAV